MLFINFILWGCIGTILLAIISAVLFPLKADREDFCIIIRAANFAFAAALAIILILCAGIIDIDGHLYDYQGIFYILIVIMALFVLFLMNFIVFITIKYAWMNWRKK